MPTGVICPAEPIDVCRAYRLDERPASPAVPDWARPAIRPQAEHWPETRTSYVIEVATADGVEGRYGPCSPTTVEVIRYQLAPAVIGHHANAYRQARLLAIGRHRSGAHFQIAAAAIQFAMLDLWSRLAETALVALLGGPTRAGVPGYASALGVDIDHPLALDVARWLVEQGYHGQKWSLPGADRGEEPSADATRLARLRDAVGPAARLMVDALNRWSLDYLTRMAPILRDHAIAWLEEPMARSGAAVASIMRTHGVPLAAGEHVHDLADQLTAINVRVFDVWQPDVGWQGGLIETMVAIDVAGARGIRVFPHGSCLSGAVLVAALCAESTLPAVEYHLTQEPRRQAGVIGGPQPDMGRFAPRAETGLVDGYRAVERTADELARRPR